MRLTCFNFLNIIYKKIDLKRVIPIYLSISEEDGSSTINQRYVSI